MKTKLVKVHIEDIKQGRIFYVSHPFYGIERIKVLSRPYMVSGIGLFFDYKTPYGISRRSVSDSGISNGKGYNNRRTFFKLKQAEEWQNKMKTDPETIDRHERHLRMNEKIEDMDRDYFK